ncbi:MAG: hypothetical protein WA789_20180 [Candidatus Acidiferrum sp.]
MQSTKRSVRKVRRENQLKVPKENLTDYGLYADFGGPNADEPPHLDIMLMASLTTALKGIGPEAPEAYFQRSVLPNVVSRGLFMARFLSIFLLPARGAQETFGIRASILLADAWRIAGDFADYYITDSNDVFEKGRYFSSIQDCFLEHAFWLRKSRKFLAVMRAMRNGVECLKQLGRCELFDERQRDDLVSTITDYGLQECDELHCGAIQAGRVAVAVPKD